MDFSLLFKTQPKFVSLITRSVKKNRLSQLYLLSGDKGVQKMQGALYIASLILCENKCACGKCKECQAIDRGYNHNLFVIDGSVDAKIKREQVDELIEYFSLTSESARVFIINNIESATPAASNALLKFLEELNDKTYGILISNNINATLQTIKSRSQVISFEKINNEDLIKIYESKSIEPEMARILSVLTNDINEGINIYHDEVAMDVLNLVKKVNEALIEEKNGSLVMNDYGKFLITNKDKKYHQMFLDLLITIIYDRLFYQLGKRDEMIFKDTFEELEANGVDARNISYKDTFKQLDVMLECKDKIGYNINLELMYMDLFIKCEVNND